MSEIRYPALYLAASAASKAAQGRFFLLTKLQLGLLAAIAVLTGISGLAAGYQRAVGVTTLALLLVTFVLTWGSRMFRFDERWFAARALAENVKSAVWHYVSLPGASQPEDDQRFVDTLREIRQRLPESKTRIVEHGQRTPEITEWMVKSRSAPLAERMARFHEERLADQRGWYLQRGQESARMERRFWTAVLGLEGLGILVALGQVWVLGSFNAVGGITTISAGLIAWLQTKRYADLANTYAVAAEDLALLEAQVSATMTAPEFERLVHDVEEAISREHSLWVSRGMT